MEELLHLDKWKEALGGLGLGGLMLWIFLKKILVSERVGADAISKQKAIAEQYEKKVVELYEKLELKDVTIELMRSQLFAAEKKQARAEGKLQALGIEFNNDDNETTKE